jgi:predicted transposase YbfD/YdcC
MAEPTVRSLADHFADLPDPRLDRHKQHALLDLIVIAVSAIVCGADTWVDVEKFGRAKRTWFQTFLTLPNGIPSHDTFGRVFALLDPAAFAACFGTWMAAACARLGLDHVAIDGKAMRGSRGGPRGTAAHVVSAFATAHGLALGQRAVADKSNEITAIPELLKVLDITGALVTIDAMGCQTKIAAQVRANGADYLLAVKANQPTLHADIDRFVTDALARGYAGVPHDFWEDHGRGHGRDEARACYVFPAAGVVTDPGAWKDLASVVLIVSERVVDGKAASEVRYYISSRSATAEIFAAGVRDHWGIENGLHWLLDVAFGDDASRVRVGHGPENFGLLRRLALAVLKQAGDKGSIRGKRLIAGWDNDYLERVLLDFLRI